MVNGKVKNYLLPIISKIPKKGSDTKNELESGEDFSKFLKGELQGTKENNLKVSNHAAKRLKERNLEMDGEEFIKLKGAMEKLGLKGGKDSLVITDKAAYILDVENQTVVTAFDKNNLEENVFTKIDSTIVIN